MDALARIRYPKKDAHLYENQIRKTKQNNFEKIEDFENTIEELVKKYSICLNLNKEEQKRKIDESLLQGLSIQTRISMAAQGTTEFETMKNKIQCLENELETLSISNNKNEVKSLNQKKKTYLKTWCSRHHSSGHNTKDCLGIPKSKDKDKKFRMKNKEENKEKIMLITEPNVNLKNLELEGFINKIPMKFTLDTGAGENFISRDFVEKCMLEAITEEKKFIVKLGDSRNLKINQRTNAHFSFRDIPDINFKEEFKIIKEAEQTIILGLKFLTRHETILDLKNLRIIISNRVIDISNENVKVGVIIQIRC